MPSKRRKVIVMEFTLEDKMVMEELLDDTGAGLSKRTTLTVGDLTLAIRNGIDNRGMPAEEAEHLAQHVLNFFGYSDRIIDNMLEPEDRDAFYMLEDTGILTTEREETTLYDGREWRIHYWLFRRDRILELISMNSSVGDVDIEVESVYDDIPDEYWSRD